MRNVVKQLGRGVSVAAVVVLLAVPNAQAGWFTRTGDRERGGSFDPSRIVKIIRDFVRTICGDEFIVPHP